MFIFVILHYNTINETTACINSINNNIQTDNKAVIVVDNNSPNGSGEVLAETYKNSTDIIVLLNDMNLGYAKGLNKGIEYAKLHYEFDFIILLNNDIEIRGVNWENIIVEKYNKYGFHVLGPDIIALDNSHGNPMNEKVHGVSDLIKIMIKHIIDIIISFFYLKNITVRMKLIIKRLMKYHNVDERVVDKDNFNVQLQGSCLVLSALYFEKYDELYGGTFLYYEEDILRYIARRDGLLLMYTPEIKLLHKEGVATKCDVVSSRRKDLFFNKHGLKSCMIFFKLILNDVKVKQNNKSQSIIKRNEVFTKY